MVSITGIGCAIQSKLYGLSKSKRDFTKDILLLKETLEMFFTIAMPRVHACLQNSRRVLIIISRMVAK